MVSLTRWDLWLCQVLYSPRNQILEDSGVSSFHFINIFYIINNYNNACLHSLNLVSLCQRNDATGKSCDMKAVQIRKQPTPSEIIP
jgi:hypothetical protein